MRYKIIAKWNGAETRLLIGKYKEYPVLWNKDVAGYGKRGPRAQAWRKLAKEFNGKTTNDLLAKVRILRGMYLRRRKRQAMMKSDSEGTELNDKDDKMKWLDELSFLDNYVSVSRPFCNVESPIISNDDAEEQEYSPVVKVEANDLSSSSNNSPLGVCCSALSSHQRYDDKQTTTERRSAMCRRRDEDLVTVSKAVVNRRQATMRYASSRPADEFDLFGQCVANELRSITDDFARDQAKLEINSTLFRAKWNSAVAPDYR